MLKLHPSISSSLCLFLLACADLQALTQSVSGSLSQYRYEEPELHVRISGPNVGARYALQHAFDAKLVMGGELQVANGSMDYTGSGTSHGNENTYGDLRTWLGVPMNQHAQNPITPILGYGARYLLSDLRGVSSTGALGYRRESHYQYALMGFQHQLLLQDEYQWSTHFEYDYLLRGEQISYLSDTRILPFNIKNKQTQGYGLRGELLYGQNKWSAGPYVSYWHIKDSKREDIDGAVFWEPRNQTLEVGVLLKYSF